MDQGIALNDGRSIPRVGFGVFQIAPEDTVEAVSHALRAGYRSIDTAAAYGNEAEVGRAIQESGLPRDEVFVTTKLWNSDQGRDRALRAFDESLGRLGLDEVDLYLIHWPAPTRGLFVETWDALVELQREGRARSIGVSNFRVEDLERVIEASGVTPVVNQIELHPLLQQEELRRFHAEQRIVTEAWSPLAKAQILEDDVIIDIADAHGRTPAQVILRWHLQLGNVVIPKSVTPARIDENADLFEFELDDEAMGRIGALDAGERTGPDPSTFSG